MEREVQVGKLITKMKLIVLIFCIVPSFCFSQTRINISGGGGVGGDVTQSALNDSTAAIRSNIKPPITINNVPQRITQLPFQPTVNRYYINALSYNYGDSTYIVVREGREHTYNGTDTVYMVRYATGDKGYSWVKDTLLFEATFDVRNYGGGVTPDGTVLIFYTRYKGGCCGGFISNRVFRSTDNQTFTASSNLSLFNVDNEFSPYGALGFCDNGDLLQTFYGDSATGGNARSIVYTLRSSDDGLTWGSPVVIKRGTTGVQLEYNETWAVHLGNGRWVAAARKEETLNKLCYLYESDDDALTWTSTGKAVWGSSDIPGVSPMLIRKSDSTAYLVSTWRGSAISFGENEIKFGDSTAKTPHRIFYDGNNAGSFGIQFGYPTLVMYGESPQDWALAFNDSSPLEDGVDISTDVVLIPFLQSRTTFVTATANAVIIPNTATYVTAQGIDLDEFPINNMDGGRSFWFIRKDGNYNLQFGHTFTTENTTGTYREVVFEKWNVRDNLLLSVITQERHYVSNEGFERFYFNVTTNLKQGEAVRCYFRHDATGNVNYGADVTNIVQIRKL